jgi:hypothetical protein
MRGLDKARGWGYMHALYVRPGIRQSIDCSSAPAPQPASRPPATPQRGPLLHSPRHPFAF